MNCYSKHDFMPGDMKKRKKRLNKRPLSAVVQKSKKYG